MSDSFATPWTVACQAPLSMGFPRGEYWSGLPFPSPEDLSNPGIELASLALPGGFLTTESPAKLVIAPQFTFCLPKSCWQILYSITTVFLSS